MFLSRQYQASVEFTGQVQITIGENQRPNALSFLRGNIIFERLLNVEFE